MLQLFPRLKDDADIPREDSFSIHKSPANPDLELPPIVAVRMVPSDLVCVVLLDRKIQAAEYQPHLPYARGQCCC